MIFSLLRLIFLIILFFIVFCFGIWGFEEIFDGFFFLINVLGFLFLNCIDILKDLNILNKFDNIIVFCNEEGVLFWLVISLFLIYCVGMFLIIYFGVLVCRFIM